jgi:hypothetical protein
MWTKKSGVGRGGSRPVSKRIRWDTDRDVIRGRSSIFDKTFLPDGLSLVTNCPS